MACFEEVIYDIGRQALAEQQSHVAGLQQRAGALVAAHALVASFLGTTSIRSRGLDTGGSLALAALAVGLLAAAAVLVPWRFMFALDAGNVVSEMQERAETEARSGTLGCSWRSAFVIRPFGSRM